MLTVAAEPERNSEVWLPPAVLARIETWSRAFDSWPHSRPSENTRRAYRMSGELFLAHCSKLPWEVGKANVAGWAEALRPTAAMLRKQAGDDVEQVSGFLAHSSLAIPQVYLHQVEGQQDGSWSKVEALLGLS